MPVSSSQFLRYVEPDHTINIAHANWPVPASFRIGTLVVAAINTTTAQLEIRHQGELITSHDYPTPTALTGPYHITSEDGLIDLVPTISRTS